MSILDDLPDPTALGPKALRLLRDLFQDTALAAVRDGDAQMARWARDIADRYALQLNIRARESRALRQWIAERRAERPHGT